MNGCIESGPALLYQQLDETVGSLVPAVESLLRQIARHGTVSSESDDAGHRFAVPVRFPDGIGRGYAVAKLFRYRDTVRVDVELAHNRVIARPDGTPSDRRCYLNDFIASVSLAAGTERLPEDFERSVARGIEEAREGVQRYNRSMHAPWGQISVVAVEH